MSSKACYLVTQLSSHGQGDLEQKFSVQCIFFFNASVACGPDNFQTAAAGALAELHGAYHLVLRATLCSRCLLAIFVDS
jgi:hypothetical protein